MKKLLVVSVILSMAIMAFAVNAPRQPLLFYDIAPSTGVSQEMANILQLAVFNDLDPETNVPLIADRFDYNFYSNSPIYAVEMSVMAAKVLGIEKQVLENYPLAAPTFRDIQTQLQKSYKGNGYDFSRDFGYFDYVNSYMKKEIGYPLFDMNVEPLTELTRAQVIKAVVRLYAAKYNDVSLVKEAEELSKRFSANKNTGITTPPCVGYISVFEKYFLTKDKEGKLIYTLSSPLFSNNRELYPNKLATRKWAIALVTEAYFSNNPVEAGALIPQRSIDNFITYTPYEKGEHEFFVTQLPKMEKGTINCIKTNVSDPSLFLVKLNSGKEIVGLDNTIVVEKKLSLAKGGKWILTSKTFNGEDFVSYYNNLADKPEGSNSNVITLVGKIKNENGKLYFVSGGKQYSLPNNVQINLKEVEINVGSANQITKLYAGELSLKNVKTTIMSTIVSYSSLKPQDITMRVKANTPFNNVLTKLNFKSATIMYYPVIDRLNLCRSYATVGSIERFNALYSNGYESIDASNAQYPLDFIDYWYRVQKALDSLNAKSDASIVGKTIMEVKVLKQPYININKNTLTATVWKIYVGKLISFEPATHRIITQNFVEPFYYSPTAPVYLTFKNGTSKEFKNMKEASKFLYTKNGLELRNIVLWFQFGKDKEGRLVVNYIIGKEL